MPTRPPHIPGTGRARPRPWEAPAQSHAGEPRGRARQADTPPAVEEGQVLAGRYRIEGRLGRGGTAEVFRATDLRLGRAVAVKRFVPGGSAADEQTFRAEARLLAGLRHPGLVTVHDAGHDAYGSYVVMELVPGATLRARLAQGPLPPEDVLRLGRRLTAALAHVHAAGIVHRDVKPTNILLGTAGEPFLADFGLSRPADESTRAEPGTLLGTIAYMAPEQVRGEGATPASDVHALGLVLLECLKGEREYAGTPPETATAKLVRPPDTSRCVPAPLVPVLAAMTHPDPAVRPTAAECARALAELPRAELPHAGAAAPDHDATVPVAALAALSGVPEAEPAAAPAPPEAAPAPPGPPDPSPTTQGEDTVATAAAAPPVSARPLPPGAAPWPVRQPAGGPEPAAGPDAGPEPEGHAPRAQGRHAGHTARQAGRRRLPLVAAGVVLAAAACGAALSWGPRTSGGGHGTATAPPATSAPGPAGRPATAPAARDGSVPAPTGAAARPTSAPGPSTGTNPSAGPGRVVAPSADPGKARTKATGPARNGHSTGGTGNRRSNGGTHGSPDPSRG